MSTRRLAGVLGGIVALGWGLGGATSLAGSGDEEVEIKRSELTRLRETAARVAPLEAQLEALQAQHRQTLAALELAEVRLRLRPFSPSALVRADFKPKLVDAARLEARDGRAKKTSLAKALEASERGLVVAYWATWCKPCTTPDELERMKRLRSELAAQGADLVFLAVDGLDEVVADPRAGGWLYPLWQRDDGHIDMLPESYVRAQGLELPLMLVVPKSGQVRWVRKGALDDDAERDLLTAVIRGD